MSHHPPDNESLIVEELMQITEDSDWKVGKEAVDVLGNCKYNIGFRPR